VNLWVHEQFELQSNRKSMTGKEYMMWIHMFTRLDTTSDRLLPFEASNESMKAEQIRPNSKAHYMLPW